LPANRTILKERDAKPLIEELSRTIPGMRLGSKGRVELENTGDAEIVLIEGHALAVRKKGVLFPSLVNVESLKSLPKVTVDMGAVPHVAGGADIMAPGIRKIEGEFQEGSLVVVVDEKYGKYLAVGKSLMGSQIMSETKKGKAVQNLHYVGDEVWEAVKSQARPGF